MIIDLAMILGTLAVASLMTIAWRSGRNYGLGQGLLAGYDEGDLDGYRRGRSEAEVAHVLDAPSLDDHFAQALLSGVLHQPVGEDMAALLGAVQKHERAARTGSAR